MNRALTTWDPFREIGEIQSRLGRLMARSPDAEGAMASPDWSPATDIAEDETAFTITADLPEVKKEDVVVKVQDGLLSFSGVRSRKTEEEDEEKSYHRVERSFGSYQRSFRLPENVDSNSVTATYEDGVLTLTLPKVPVEEPEETTVEVQ